MSGREPGAGETAHDLAALREEVEELDREILEAVARRVDLARRIGGAKRAAASGTLDPNREAAVIRRAVETARSLNLPEEPVRELFWTLVGLCRSAQLEGR